MERVRTPRTDRRVGEPAGGTAEPRIKPAAVLSLQRSIGNAAVARLVRASRSSLRPRRQLARFVGPEHEDLGNAINVNIDFGNGIVLTWGQVVAIAGDEYGTIDQLFADAKDPARRVEIRAALEHAEVKGPIPSTLPKPTDEQKNAHETTFVMLAFDNADHFPDSGRALGAWGLYHGRALSAAAKAGLANDPAGMNLAYAIEAFGQHFLTDCFSGSHIRTPRAQIIRWYTETWAPRAVPVLLDSIETEMVDRLTAEADPQTHMPHAYVHNSVYEDVHATLQQMTSKLGGDLAFQRLIALAVGGALSGTMHDAEGAAGVVVSSSDHPAPWIAYGDNKLGSSPTSREEAIKAVLAAKAQVDRAYVIGEEVGAEPGNENFPERTKNRAYLRIHQELEPSVRAVEPFVPRPVEERPQPQASYPPAARANNTSLPEWKWGNLSDSFADAVNSYVKSEVGTKLVDALQSPDLKAQTKHGVTVHPRDAAEAIVNELMKAPVDEIARRIGWPARALKSGSGAAAGSRAPAGVP